MPTTQSGRKVLRQLSQSSYNSGLTWSAGSVTERVYYERVRTWPTAVKRAVPKDLYLGGTGRTVSTTFRSDTGFDFYTFTNPRGRTFNAPVATYFYLGDKSVPLNELVDKELVYNKIRADVRGDATNLAQMMAEYAQTAKLFRDLAEAVVTKGRSMLRKIPRNALSGTVVKKYSQSASDAYLGFTYGVSPLCDDMASAMNELRERSGIPLYREGVETRTVKGKASGKEGISSTVNSSTLSWDGLRIQRYRCQWRAYVDQNALRNVLFSHGFGNPLAVGWELVPFSFVIDWWVNIGEVLASLDNMILIDKLYVLESTSDKTLLMGQTDAHREIFKPGSQRLLKRVDTRYAPTTISKVSSFRYKPSVSLKHIMNGLALLNSLRR